MEVLPILAMSGGGSLLMDFVFLFVFLIINYRYQILGALVIYAVVGLVMIARSRTR